MSGFAFGFDIGCITTPCISGVKNHNSVNLHPEVMEQYISKGQIKNRIAGPFDLPPFKNFVVSPLGVAPKSEPSKFRVIHDLSYPMNNYVNSGIPKEKSHVDMTQLITL